MKINKLLAAVIFLLTSILAVMLALVVRSGGKVPGESNDNTASGTPDSGEDLSEYSYDENVSFPEELSIIRLTVADIEQVAAKDFVSATADIDYSVDYAKAPDLTQTGWQDIILRFRYKGNLFQRSAHVYVFHIERERKYELSGSGSADISDFVQDTSVGAVFDEPDISKLSLSAAGRRSVAVTAAGKRYTVNINVADTTPPTATPVEQTVAVGRTLDASAFVGNIKDFGAVSCSFETAPRWGELGTQKVTVLLTDNSGNVGKCVCVLNVKEISLSPVFTGLTDIKICVGETIAYRSGVECTDIDGNIISFKIDPSNVDRNKQGTYEAIYTATDSKGNSARETRKVIVYEVTQELVNELCDKILSEIIKDSYSTDEKIKAVWKWTKRNITYVGSSVSYEDELRVAYAAFETHSGDCFTYYISNKYLLNRLGIPNVEVKRVESVTRHWWNLVKFSNGKWYHVDSSAHPAVLDRATYKMTESDLVWFTEQFKTSRHPNYYEYDHSLPVYDGLNIAQ